MCSSRRDLEHVRGPAPHFYARAVDFADLGRTLAEMLAEAAPALRNGKRAEHASSSTCATSGRSSRFPSR